MMKFGFSANELQFFIMDKKNDYEKNGIWPVDIVEVDDDLMHEYSEIPPKGKKLGADNKGYPKWVSIPRPAKKQLVEQAEAQKQYLIAEVNAETQILQTKLALKRIKPAELELLNAWLDYLDLLEAVDTSPAPDIDWPQKPI